MKRKKKCKYVSKKKIKKLVCGGCHNHQKCGVLGSGQCCINPEPIYRRVESPVCLTHYSPK